jgi:hypothetical protein
MIVDNAAFSTLAKDVPNVLPESETRASSADM